MAADKWCGQHDQCDPEPPRSVLVLPIESMAPHQRYGLDHITDWDWLVCIHHGGPVGYTFDPGTSPYRPKYLPLSQSADKAATITLTEYIAIH